MNNSNVNYLTNQVAVSSRTNFENEIVDFFERLKNYTMKKTIKVFGSLKPFGLLTKAGNKTIALINLLATTKIFPVLTRSLEGAGEILALGGFVSLLTTYVPYLTKDNLDGSGLEASLKGHLKDGEEKLVLGKVKEILEENNNESDIRADIKEYLEKSLGVDSDQSKTIAFSVMRIRTKQKDLIERIYTHLFFIPALAGFFSSVEKFGASFAPVIKVMSQSRVGTLLVNIGMRKIALIVNVIALSLKLGHNTYLMVSAQAKIWRLPNEAPDSEKEKHTKDRTKAIWGASISAGKLVLAVVPLILVINPVLFTAYEIVLTAVELADAIKN